MGQPWTRAGLGATCALAVLAGLGLTGCQNLGQKAAEAVTQPHPGDHHGPTPRSARAFVRKTFVLYDRGEFRRACAFSESKAYRAVDRACAKSSAKSVAQLHAAGVDVVPNRITTQLVGSRGTATLWWFAHGQRASIFVYLRYDGHRWWMTGEKKTGDVGL